MIYDPDPLGLNHSAMFCEFPAKTICEFRNANGGADCLPLRRTWQRMLYDAASCGQCQTRDDNRGGSNDRVWQPDGSGSI